MQIAAWDANVITAHRRMGNTGLSLKDLSDGMSFRVQVFNIRLICKLVTFPGRVKIQLFIHQLIIIVGTKGKKHEVELELGGMGGGGAIQLEVSNVISTLYAVLLS